MVSLTDVEVNAITDDDCISTTSTIACPRVSPRTELAIFMSDMSNGGASQGAAEALVTLKHLHSKNDKIDTTQNEKRFHTRTFAKSCYAKSACISSKAAFGVSQENDLFMVYYQNKDGLNITNIDTQWLYLKARSNNDNLIHLVKLKDAHYENFKRGIVRRSYFLNNGMFLKIYHYSCKVLENSKKCRNCMNDKSNGRCLLGRQHLVLVQNN